MTDRLNPEALDQQALEAACKTLWESAANYPRRWEDVSPAVQEGSRRTVRKFTAAYLAALPAPRTITTIAELDALPYESIVLDADDDHLMLVADGEGGSYWVRFDDTDFYLTSDIALPARVLWVPTEGGGE